MTGAQDGLAGPLLQAHLLKGFLPAIYGGHGYSQTGQVVLGPARVARVLNKLSLLTE